MSEPLSNVSYQTSFSLDGHPPGAVRHEERGRLSERIIKINLSHGPEKWSTPIADETISFLSILISIGGSDWMDHPMNQARLGIVPAKNMG